VLWPRFGVGVALLYAGLGIVAMTAFAWFMPLPETTVDLTSWNHWRLAITKGEALPSDNDFGPVLVTVEYQVTSQQAREFLKALRQHAAFDAVTVRKGGVSSATWKMRRGTSKHSSSPPGRSISANTTALRARIARRRSECGDLPGPNPKCVT